MSLATLTFTLPEEQDEHNLAMNGWRYKAALCELDHRLRDLQKHGTPAGVKGFTVETARAWLRETLEEQGIEDIY